MEQLHLYCPWPGLVQMVRGNIYHEYKDILYISAHLGSYWIYGVDVNRSKGLVKEIEAMQKAKIITVVLPKLFLLADMSLFRQRNCLFFPKLKIKGRC